MCGIFGKWNLDGAPVDPALLIRMRDSMVHRGPDDYGSVLLSSKQNDKNDVKAVEFKDAPELSNLSERLTAYNICLSHRRLSIIDLETGAQPMSNADGTIWTVFNGEIYNYRELREELIRRGHSFRTASDTEVLIHAYEEFGTNCPIHLNGIFAFAIWDDKQNTLFLARDHYGVKPLYYHYSQFSKSFYFASELKAILCDSAVEKTVDLDALNLCLTFRHTPSPWTMLKFIKKLAPGCFMTITRDGIKEGKYRKDYTVVDRITSENEWIERLQIAVEAAVVGQMVSDVPISVSLSSGVDSNTVLALMHKHSTSPVNAFTVGFSGREKESEIGPARKMADLCDAHFYSQIITSENYSNFMSKYMWHLEEPIGNESAAAYFFVAEMARQQGIKVLLNGQGADEAFAGYGRYIGAAYGNLLKVASLTPFRLVLSKMFSGTLLGERYQRFLYTVDASSEADRFLRTYSVMNSEMRGRLVKPEILSQMDSYLSLGYVDDQLACAPKGTMLERMTFVDARTILPDNLLLCEDKMSMAASVEARVPFLDLELMAIAEQIPGKYKLRGLRDKYIHRKVCRKWVAKNIASRPQIGFDNAVDMWFKKQLGKQMLEAVKSQDSFASNYLNPEYISVLMHEHIDGQRDHQRILFLLLSLESWYDVFF